jgi:hypothetical protein
LAGQGDWELADDETGSDSGALWVWEEDRVSRSLARAGRDEGKWKPRETGSARDDWGRYRDPPL